MREKINEWEELENQRAIQKALYHHVSISQLVGDYSDHPVNPDVVNLLRLMEAVDENNQTLQQNLDANFSKFDLNKDNINQNSGDLEKASFHIRKSSISSPPRRNSSFAKSADGTPIEKQRKRSKSIMVQGDSSQQKEAEEQLSKSVKKTKSHLDRYVDNFWKKNLEDKDLSISEIDGIIHKFIHNLLLMAEDDPQMQHAVHLKNSMIQHQEMILSIKDAIKPGIFQTFYKPYTKDQIKNYFTRLQVRKSQQNKK